MSILDLLFPKFCVVCRAYGAYICTTCFSRISFQEHAICLMCGKPAFGGLTHPICKNKYAIDGVFSSLIYSGVVKKIVYRFKYKPFITELQTALVELFYEGLIQKELFYPLLAKPSVLVPIPLHASRFRMRGYNQSELLAKGLASRFDLPVIDALARIKKTHTQVGLSQEERLDNIHNAFVQKVFISGDVQVFLVDDVMTSGATLHEAARVLKKAGIRNVWGVTLAHGRYK